MTTWSLEPGNERPINMKERTNMVKSGIGTIDVDEIKRRVELLGARVEAGRGKIKIFPPDSSKAPIFVNERLGSGTDRTNAIMQLRRAGLDILDTDLHEDTAQAAPSPAAVAKMRTTGGRPTLSYEKPTTTPTTIDESVAWGDHLLELMVEAERRIEDQHLQIEALLTRIEDLDTRQVRDHETLKARIKKLENPDGVLEPKKSTIIEIAREVVFAFMIAHPNIKMSPEVIKMNVGDKIPEYANPTTVANACKDLAIAGKLKGGGTNTGQRTKGSTPTTRGIYWYEPEDNREK